MNVKRKLTNNKINSYLIFTSINGKLIATRKADNQLMNTAHEVAFPLELDENNSAVINHGIELGPIDHDIIYKTAQITVI